MATESAKKYLSGLVTLILALGIVVPTTYLSDIPLTKALTYQVTTNLDNGAGSFRQAIADANANGGTDTITFAASMTINTASDLVISSNIIIDGTSAPDDIGNGPDVIIQGNVNTDCLHYSTGGAGSIIGFTITGCRNGMLLNNGADGVTIGGTNARDLMDIKGSTQAGIAINTANNITIYNSSIGINNANQVGVDVMNATTINIGGSSAGQRNIIAKNTQSGINIGSATGVTIAGNYIGVDASSGNPNGNGQNGIQITGSSQTTSNITIGGGSDNARNYISSNGQAGIQVQTGAANNVTITRNFIGVSSTGFAVGNSTGGVMISTSNNQITNNVISGNLQSGLTISGTGAVTNTIDNNKIGVDVGGNVSVKNNNAGISINTNASETTISNNVISGNQNDGVNITNDATGTTYFYGNKIGLGNDGVTQVANGQGGINASAKITVGDSANDSRRNYIGGNKQAGIHIGNITGSLSTIANNFIGLGMDGTTPTPNLGTGILIDAGASGVTIGSLTGTMQEIANSAGAGIKFDSGSSDENIVYRNNLMANGLVPIASTNGAQGNLVLTTGNLVVNSSGASGTSSVFPGVMTILSGPNSNAKFIAETNILGDGTWSYSGKLGNGENYWLYARDSKRTTPTTATGVVAHDNVAPVSPALTSSTGVTSTISYTLTGTKEKDSSVFNDNSSIVAIDGLTSWTSSTSLVEGVNTFNLDSRDYTDNVSSTGSFTVTLDTIPPATPILTYDAVNAGATATITGTTEGKAKIYLNDVFTTTAAIDGTFTVTPAIVAGSNLYNIYAIDDAGNIGPTATASVSTTSGGGGSSGSSSAGSTSSTSTSTTTTDTTTDTTTTDTGESMAGEPETTTDTTTDTTTETPSSDTSTDVNLPPSTETTTGESAPVAIETPTETVKPTYTNLYAPDETQATEETETVTTEEPTTSESTEVFVAKIDPIFSPALLQSDFMGETGTDQIPLWWKEQNFSDDTLEISAETDTDSDGLSDIQEFQFGTDPKEADSDSDGVSDTVEINSGSSPSSYDTDGDGISDDNEKPEEVAVFNPKVVDPEVVDQYIAENNIVLDTAAGETIGEIDTDNDGMSDQQELQMGSDAANPDSDSDGLSDGEEVLLYNSNPIKASKVSAVSIGNIKKGQVNSVGAQQIMGGTNTPNVEISIYIIDANGKQTNIGTTKTDSKGFYSILTSEVQEGKYTITSVMSKGTKTISVSDPLELNVAKTVSVVEPEIAVTVENNNVKIDGLAKSKDSSIVVTWRSLVLTNTIVADQNFQLLPPEALEGGDHTATVYTVSNIDNSQSAPVQVQFTLSTTGFASGQTQGISPLITIGGSSLILISLIALAIFRRRNNGGDSLKK